MSVTRPALRYHGAKFRLAHWTMRFFPEHVCYVWLNPACSAALERSRGGLFAEQTAA